MAGWSRTADVKAAQSCYDATGTKVGTPDYSVQVSGYNYARIGTSYKFTHQNFSNPYVE